MQGTHRPELASSAATSTLRIRVLLPLMLGAVSRYRPFNCTGLRVQEPLSIQYGDSPLRLNAGAAPTTLSIEAAVVESEIKKKIKKRELNITDINER